MSAWEGSTMTETTLLTDDELVALALHAEVQWHGPLPTVNVGDVGELERAAARGVRSLGVRGLIDSAGEPTVKIARAIEEATRETPALGVTVVDQQQPWITTGVSLAVQEGTEPLIIATIETGVSHFWRAPKELAAQNAAELARVLFEQVPPEQSHKNAALIVRKTSDGHLVALVAYQAAQVAHLDSGLDASEIHWPEVPTSADFPRSLFELE